MKEINKKDIYISWGLTGGYVVFFVLGIVFVNLRLISVGHWILALSGVFAVAFMVYSIARLKCPHCGTNDNLFRFTHALKQNVYCRSCGKLIRIPSARRQ